MVDRVMLIALASRQLPGFPGMDAFIMAKRAVAQVPETRQDQRQGVANAQLSPDRLASVCLLGDNEKSSLESAARRMHLSGRGLHRTLRVARTIADLDDSETIGMAHLSEALAYRG